MLKSIYISFTFLFLLALSLSLNLPAPPPPGAVGPYLNGIFPPSAPGDGGSWELEDPAPDLNIPSPVRMISLPGSSDFLVLSKTGQVWQVTLSGQSSELLLDISDQVFYKGEAGAVGMALHPAFGDLSAPGKQHIYLYYRTKPQPGIWDERGYNRLSRFRWDAPVGRFDPASEEILIQQYDRSTWHNGGAMFFGPDGFLYLSAGDEGSEGFQAVSTQNLSGGFFSGILRIDVDNDPSRSHPIRRQPIANGQLPEGWEGETFSQGYSIPNDNPWLDPEGSILEEYYAIGIRSPYAMFFDEETAQIWLADVGAATREEINLVDKGDNLQWPYREGPIPSDIHQKPADLIGREKAPYYAYDRTTGSCIIGGMVYQGTQFPELNGKYLFADFVQNKVFALTNTGNQSAPDIEIMLNDLQGQPVTIPAKPGITSIFQQENGDILLAVMDDIRRPGAPGKIFRLKYRAAVAEPPARLSELGAFTDLQSLTPAPGIIPYQVNSPLWSDRALKKRWIALPNDGQFDSPEEQITFHSQDEWVFPEGTVFIKHFELPLTDDPSGNTARLETRFFVIADDSTAYGLTYKWNADGTEAYLLGGGASKDYDIYEDGSFAFTQSWDFPSRDQCLSCHNANAGYVLGVKTHQLNGEMDYPHLGRPMNQLEYFNQAGMFQRDIGSAESYLRSYPIDDGDASLELRIRSYLDANCASCHRPGGVSTSNLDFRLTTPLILQNIVNAPTSSPASSPDGLIVEPGSYQTSELWKRDNSTNENRMPPLARNLVDQSYIDALIEWIGRLPESSGKITGMLVFPNPSSGWLTIKISEDWTPPFQLAIQNELGQLIRRETFELNTYGIDLGSQPAGLYLLELSDSQEQRHTGKVVLH